MTELRSGMLVEHASLGLGKVVALEKDDVHVFFQASETRFATKLRLSLAGQLLSASTTKNPWLKELSSFSLDPDTRRYGLARKWMRQDQALARFTELFPDGFTDRKFLEGKLALASVHWRAAQSAFAKAFGDEQGEQLLAAGKVAELSRRALQVVRHVAPLYPAAERNLLQGALVEPDTSRDYFAALFAVLATPEPERSSFEALAAAAQALPHESEEFGWYAATLLPFLARPDRHVVLRPKVACDAADRLGFDLAYQAKPNWPTYAALLRRAHLLMAALAPLGARDHVDIECFIQVVTSKRESA